MSGAFKRFADAVRAERAADAEREAASENEARFEVAVLHGRAREEVWDAACARSHAAHDAYMAARAVVDVLLAEAP